MFEGDSAIAHTEPKSCSESRAVFGQVTPDEVGQAWKKVGMFSEAGKVTGIPANWLNSGLTSSFCSPPPMFCARGPSDASHAHDVFLQGMKNPCHGTCKTHRSNRILTPSRRMYRGMLEAERRSMHLLQECRPRQGHLRLHPFAHDWVAKTCGTTMAPTHASTHNHEKMQFHESHEESYYTADPTARKTDDGDHFDYDNTHKTPTHEPPTPTTPTTPITPTRTTATRSTTTETSYPQRREGEIPRG